MTLGCASVDVQVLMHECNTWYTDRALLHIQVI